MMASMRKRFLVISGAIAASLALAAGTGTRQALPITVTYYVVCE